jgi:hypothetical protein
MQTQRKMHVLVKLPACLAALLLCMLVLLDSGQCQTAAYNGTITGIVADAAGAVIPGAEVTAINTATGLQTGTKTNEVGAFTIPNIAAGTYTVRIVATGFRALEKTGILLDPNGVVRADTALTVGQATETVRVTESDAPLLETQQTTLDQTIAHEFIESLPNEVSGGIRDITSLLNLSPTVVQGSGSFQTNIASGRGEQTELLLDGVPLVYSPGLYVALSNRPDQDIISEVQVQYGVPTAEWGHSTGGIGTFISRSGTNQFHGDGVLILRNTILDATPDNSTTKNQDQQFELPVSVGGPIFIPHLYNGRDKSFFFFNYSAYRQHASSPPQVVTVPTDLERQGNFSQLPDNAGDGTPRLLVDPLTGQLFPAIPSEAGCTIGRCIPQSRFSALSQAYMSKFIPSATISGLVNNYIGRTPNSDLENHYYAKIDHRIGESNTVHGAFRWDDTNVIEADGPWGMLLSGRTYTQGVRVLSLDDDVILRHNLVNSLSAAYTRWIYASVGTPLNIFPQIPGSYGQGFPVVSLAGGNYSSGWGNQNAFNLADPSWNFNEGLSWEHGKHSSKFGARYSNYQGQGLSGAAQNGDYTFSSIDTGAAAADWGDPFASFLLGEVNSASMVPPSSRDTGDPYWAFFGQDSWRITPTLTANLGVRYEIPKPEAEPLGFMNDLTVPNPGANNLPGATVFASTSGNGRQFFPTWYKALAPRIGLAWSAHPNTVVRAAYGVLYGPIEGLLLPGGFGGTGLTENTGQPIFEWDTGFSKSQVVPYVIGVNPTLQNGVSGIAADGFGRGGENSDRVNDTQILQLDVQQTVKSFLFGAGYIGQLTHHINGNPFNDSVNLAFVNQLPVDDMKYGSLLTLPITDPAVVATGVTAPFPQFVSTWGGSATMAQALRNYPQYGDIYYEVALGNSTYHGAVLRAETRGSHGLQFIGSFTISKTLTDSNLATSATLNVPQNQYDRRWEKSVSTLDVPRVLLLTYNYQLPVGRGKSYLSNGVLGRVLEGFQISGNQLYQAGTPIQIQVPNDDLPIFNGGALDFDRGTGPFTTGHRGSIHLGNSLYGTTGTTYLNQAAFLRPPTFNIPDPTNPGNIIANPAVVANPYSALGNLKAALPNVRNLGYFNENLSLYKNQTFHDRYTLHFGFELIDAFNRQDYGCLNTYYGSQGFGTYGCAANGPRVVQLDTKITF